MRLSLFLLTILLGILAGIAGFFIYLGRSLQGAPLQTARAPLAVSAPAAGAEQARPSFAPQNLGGQAFLLPLSEASFLPIRDFNVPEPVLSAKAAALFDIRSGRFLYSKNTNQRLPIASITKLMSAIVVLENLDLNDTFVVPPENINVDGKGADFSKNERVLGTDLFKIMLIKSSNDAALTFATAAQKIGINFVDKMNEKAQAIGMFDTKFTNPAGLDDYEAFSTASDLIKLVRYTAKYDLISQTLKTKLATVTMLDGGVRHLVNTDLLLGSVPGIVLGKTGYTDGALGTMVLEVSINGGQDTIVSVILGSNDRFEETQRLIEWSKTAYRWQ